MARWITPLQQLVDLRDEYKEKVQRTLDETGDIYAVVEAFEHSFYVGEPYVGVDVLDNANDINITVIITPIEPGEKWGVKFIAISPNVVETYSDTWELTV